MKNRIQGWALGLGALALILTLGAPTPSIRAEEPAPEEGATRKTPPLMQQKLDAMKGALEGIALRDFRKIRESGDLLQRISVIDQWLKYEDTEYSRMTEDFRRAVELMIMMGDVENLEGATLHFQNVTNSCLECHNFMREPGQF